MHVVVVGAGALGASVARALAPRCRVTVLERGEPGGGTTSAGAGLLSEVTWFPENVRLVAATRWILEKEGVFHPAPGVTLLSAEQAERGRDLAALVREAGGRAGFVSVDEVRADPSFARLALDGVAAAITSPRDGWGSPPAWARLALRRAEEAGADVRRGEAARVEGYRVVLTGGERLTADAIVVAGGVWAAGLLERSGLPVPVGAYRTQAAIFEAPPGAPILHDAIEGFYARPAPEGVLAGDGTDLSLHDPLKGAGEADTGFAEVQRGRLRRRGLAPGRCLRAWAGLEAGTPDRHPLAGPDPRAPGLFLLVGGNGFGFMRSAALGEALADAVLGETPRHDLSAFAPARFDRAWGRAFALREGFTL